MFSGSPTAEENGCRGNEYQLKQKETQIYLHWRNWEFWMHGGLRSAIDFSFT
jgi:hypothetical protein